VRDTVPLVDYFYIDVPDKPGEGAHVFSHLKEAGVNLLAIDAFPKGRRAQMDFCQDPVSISSPRATDLILKNGVPRCLPAKALFQ